MEADVRDRELSAGREHFHTMASGNEAPRGHRTAGGVPTELWAEAGERLTNAGRRVCRVPVLPYQGVELRNVEAHVAIVTAKYLWNRESVFIGAEFAVDGIVETDQPTLDHEQDDSRLGRIVCNDQCMGLPGRLVDERAGPGDPVVFKVTPVAPECVAAHRADMIANAKLCAGQSLQ